MITLTLLILVLALLFTVMAIGGKSTLPAAVLLLVLVELLRVLPIGKA